MRFGKEKKGRDDDEASTLGPERSGAREFRAQLIALVRFCATPVLTAVWAFYFAHAIHPSTEISYIAIPSAAIGAFMFFVRPFAPPAKVRAGYSMRRERIESILLFVMLDMLIFPAFFGHMLRGILPDQLVTNLVVLGLAYCCCRFFVAPRVATRFFKGQINEEQENEDVSSSSPSVSQRKADEDDGSWFNDHGHGD